MNYCGQMGAKESSASSIPCFFFLKNVTRCGVYAPALRQVYKKCSGTSEARSEKKGVSEMLAALTLEP